MLDQWVYIRLTHIFSPNEVHSVTIGLIFNAAAVLELAALEVHLFQFHLNASNLFRTETGIGTITMSNNKNVCLNLK